MIDTFTWFIFNYRSSFFWSNFHKTKLTKSDISITSHRKGRVEILPKSASQLCHPSIAVGLLSGLASGVGGAPNCFIFRTDKSWPDNSEPRGFLSLVLSLQAFTSFTSSLNIHFLGQQVYSTPILFQYLFIYNLH